MLRKYISKYKNSEHDSNMTRAFARSVCHTTRNALGI